MKQSITVLILLLLSGFHLLAGTPSDGQTGSKWHQRQLSRSVPKARMSEQSASRPSHYSRLQDRKENARIPREFDRILRKKGSDGNVLKGAKPWRQHFKHSLKKKSGLRNIDLNEGLTDTLLAAWSRHYSSGLAPSLDAPAAMTTDVSGNVYVTGYNTGVFSRQDFATIKYNSSGVQQWVATYNGTGNDIDAAVAVTVDGAGNVYVTGYSVGLDTEEDFATVKYNSNGVQLWVARYNGPANDYDAPVAIRVDGSGNVYVTGVSYGLTSDADYLTIKYNSSGAQLWVSRYNGPANDYDVPVGLGIDLAGSVYVSGTVYDHDTYEDIVTLKYSFTGDLVWVARYNGPGADMDLAVAVTSDISGNSYVTGTSLNINFDTDYVTLKYDTFGRLTWSSRYNSPEESDDMPAAIFVDAARNVYVTGTTYAFGTGDDYTTIKYSSTGSLRWIAKYNGPASSLDEATSLAVDSSGNVYVCGASIGLGTYEDIATVKYNSLGAQQWAVRYSGPSIDFDAGTGVVFDLSGNVTMCGLSYGLVTDEDWVTVRYNSAGVQQWAQRYNGPGNSSDEAVGISLDNSGNVYVAGTSYDLVSQSDFASVRYNPGGSEQWVARYNGPGDAEDFASDVVVDGSGNVVVVGTSFGLTTGYDMTTVKYSSTGSQLWTNRYSSAGNFVDEATAVTVDAAGNIYVTGSRYVAGTLNDYATIKYNPTGVQQWLAVYNGSANGNDQALAVGTDLSGNVYVTGRSVSITGRFDIATVKYSPSGVQQWVARYNGPIDSTDEGYAIAVDASGNVYVAGVSAQSGTGMDYVVLKYSTAGALQWTRTYGGSGIDIATSLKLDPSGNVYVTGGSQGATSGYDYATVKYNNAGLLQWIARYNSSENDDDVATALAIDKGGNIHVTGYSYAFKSGDDFATIKYTPSGQLQWVTRFDSPANFNDEPAGIAVDAVGNVVVGGFSETEDGSVYSTVKYDAPQFRSPVSITFPSTQVGCRATDSMVVRNTGTVNLLVVTGSTVTDPNFTITPAYFTVRPNDSIRVAVRFAPLTPGVKSGKLFFYHTGLSSPDSVILGGSGTGSGAAVTASPNLGLGWQLFSLPVQVLCPYVIPFSYAFNNQYFRSDSITGGRGYWTKLSYPIINFTGFPATAGTFAVVPGWNLIGSVSSSIAVSSITSTPDSIIRTSFFGYAGAYTIADTIKPGYGYWVKITSPGQLNIGAGSPPGGTVSQQGFDGSGVRLVITDALQRSQTLFTTDLHLDDPDRYELPPVPPSGAFDVRFSTNMLVGAIRSARELPLLISGAVYPVTIGWESRGSAVEAEILTDGRPVALQGTGSLILEREVGVTVRGIGQSGIPGEFHLEQNYPNPFNPQTSFSYHLPVPAGVRISVIDILGRELAVVVDGVIPAGIHTAGWGGKDHSGLPVSSGVYFLRIEATGVEKDGKSFTRINKMLLVR